MIRKDTVTHGRETEAGGSLEKINFFRGKRERGKGVKGKPLQPGARSLSLFLGHSLQDPPFLNRRVLSLRVPGVLSAPSLATARM